MDSGTITIEATNVVAVGVSNFDATLTQASITLPSDPIQDGLITEIKDSDAQWTLTGHTDLYIHGSLVGSNFQVIADGTDLATASLVLDFRSGTCSGHSVTVTAGSIAIDSNNDAVLYGEAFTDIQLIMSGCNDSVFIESTYESASSIEVIGTSGVNRIELGSSSRPFEDQIHCNIILDGGTGSNDVLKIHDSSSSMLKPDLALRPTMITGIHRSADNTISMFNVELVDFELGTMAANLTVFATAKDTSVVISTQSESDEIHVENGKFDLIAIKGDSSCFLPTIT